MRRSTRRVCALHAPLTRGWRACRSEKRSETRYTSRCSPLLSTPSWHGAARVSSASHGPYVPRLTQVWRQGHTHRLAARYYNEGVLRVALAVWRSRSDGAHELERRGEAYARTLAAHALQRAWAQWRGRATAHTDVHRAAAYWRRGQLQRAWTHWRRHARLAEIRNTAAGRLYADHSRTRVHAALHYWILRERAAYSERVRNAQLVRTVWNVWWVRFTEQSVARQGTLRRSRSRAGHVCRVQGQGRAQLCVECVEAAANALGARADAGRAYARLPPGRPCVAPVAHAPRRAARRRGERGYALQRAPRAARMGAVARHAPARPSRAIPGSVRSRGASPPFARYVVCLM